MGLKEHQDLKLRRQKVNKFKFTKEMVNERFIKMLQEQPGQPGNQPVKPNVLEELLAKGRLSKGNERTQS